MSTVTVTTPTPRRQPKAAGQPALHRFSDAADTFAAVGDPHRLHILWLLGQGEHHVTDLIARVSQRQQAISHHLTILKLRRLVVMDRRGRSNFYSLTESGRSALDAALPFLLSH